MLAPVHLRYTRASTIASPVVTLSLSDFLSSEMNCKLLNSSVAGPGAQASLRRLLKGLQDEHAEAQLSKSKTSLAVPSSDREAQKAAKRAAKEKKRKNKDAAEGETKRRKV